MPETMCFVSRDSSTRGNPGRPKSPSSGRSRPSRWRAADATRRSLRLASLALTLAAAPAAAQYRLAAPGGEAIEFDRDTLLAMRDRSDALYRELEEDPLVLYYTAYGPELTPEQHELALPWNAVDVVTDSSAAVVTPGNLREADRAYYNYAVLRMHAVRDDPDVPCADLFAREMTAVDGFVDGWIVARTLFGGPPFAPLDELAFARAAGVLDGFVAASSDRQLGGCLDAWKSDHPDAVERFSRWRAARDAGA